MQWLAGIQMAQKLAGEQAEKKFQMKK